MQVVTGRIAVGERMPEVAFPRLDGGELGFGELRGKRVLLFMWGSW